MAVIPSAPATANLWVAPVLVVASAGKTPRQTVLLLLALLLLALYLLGLALRHVV